MDEETKELRKRRGNIRRAIEDAANDNEVPGVVTAFIVIAEVTGYDEEADAPCRTLWLDHGFHDDTGLVPWTLSGLMDSAYGALLE